MFVDETLSKPEDLRRKYGYALDAQPAFMHINNLAHGDTPPLNSVCAISLEGLFAFHILEDNAPPLTKERFLQLFEQHILVNCNPFPHPRSVIILDNATVHPIIELQLLCAQHGVLLFSLPPYSYDLSPIELAFHQAKNYVRARYTEAEHTLREKLTAAFQDISAEDARHYFHHCGYF